MAFTHLDFYILDTNEQFQLATEDDIVAAALTILDERIFREDSICTTKDACSFFALKLGNLEHEIFAVLFLDSRNHVIQYVELFRGTINQASVYPREVVKAALQLNAASAIFSHNHPSGETNPSRADEHLTKVLKDALELVGVKVLDHIIVAGGSTMSFAERGLL